MDQEILAQIDHCLARLPARQREVLALHFLSGLSREQVALELGVSVDAVHQYCHRGLEGLRGLLGRRGTVVSASALALTLSSQAQAGTISTAMITPTVASGAAATTYAAGAISAMFITSILTPTAVAAGFLVLLGGAAIAVSSGEPAVPPVDPGIQAQITPGVSSTPSGIQELLRAGLKQFHVGNSSAAEQSFTKALQLHPGDRLTHDFAITWGNELLHKMTAEPLLTPMALI